MATQTAAEHIQNIENKRAAHVARMADIMKVAADDNRTLQRGRSHRTRRPRRAGQELRRRSRAGGAAWKNSRSRRRRPSRPSTAKQRCARLGPAERRTGDQAGAVRHRAASRRAMKAADAVTYAEKRWNDSTPEVALALKAAVAAGTTTDATWAKPLVNPAITDDFLPLLRAATILGKIHGLHKVPFNVNVPAQTAGGVVNWVGELKPKPVSAMAFAMETLGFNKVAAIVVLSQELVRFSNPSAEAVVRDSLVEGHRGVSRWAVHQSRRGGRGRRQSGLDHERRAHGGGDDESAGRHHGVDQSLRDEQHPGRRADVHHVAANALALSFRTNLDGSPEFPGVGVNGGTYKGLQFITSNTVTTNVVALAPQYILYADDGGVTIDASTEASLQMDSAPASPPDATTVYASMFQMNAVGAARRAVHQLEARRGEYREVPDRDGLAGADGRRRWRPSPNGTERRRRTDAQRRVEGVPMRLFGYELTLERKARAAPSARQRHERLVADRA